MKRKGKSDKCVTGYGGHFRAVQAFKYIGENDSKILGNIDTPAYKAAEDCVRKKGIVYGVLVRVIWQ